MHVHGQQSQEEEVVPAKAGAGRLRRTAEDLAEVQREATAARARGADEEHVLVQRELLQHPAEVLEHLLALALRVAERRGNERGVRRRPDRDLDLPDLDGAPLALCAIQRARSMALSAA